MKNQSFSTAIIINSVKGNPNFIRMFDLTESIKAIPFAIKLRGLTLSREYRNEKRKIKPIYSFLISSLNNIDEESVIRKFLGITNKKIDEIEEKEYVTVYADYIDKEEGLIFIEFLDKRNRQVGPRMKMKIITRKI
jgi:rRNA maturation protein Rpf1